MADAKNKGGRPLKFGVNGIGYFTFRSEQEIVNRLFRKIDGFMESVFNEKVITATNKKYYANEYTKINKNQLIPKRQCFVDLWVECESGRNYLFEVKNLKFRNQTFDAIGQILGYSMKFPEATNLVIVANKYDEGFKELIEKYGLPVDFVLVTDEEVYLLTR